MKENILQTYIDLHYPEFSNESEDVKNALGSTFVYASFLSAKTINEAYYNAGKYLEPVIDKISNAVSLISKTKITTS